MPFAFVSDFGAVPLSNHRIDIPIADELSKERLSRSEAPRPDCTGSSRLICAEQGN